jgi:hypothetical protein
MVMTTVAMAETVTGMAKATATATAMMPPPPPLATLSMKTTAVLQGWRLDGSDWTTTVMAMGGQQLAECLQVLRHPSKATIN